MDGATGWYLQQRREGGQYGPVEKNLNPSPIHGSGFSRPTVIDYRHTITGLENNTRYFFRVGMTNGNCQGAQCEGPPSDLSLTRTVGGASSGGAEALFNLSTLESLADNDDLNNRRLELQLSYGLPVLGDRFTLVPELELGLYESGRDYRIGWNLKRLPQLGSLALSLDATRRETTNNDATPTAHGIELKLDAQF